MQKYKIANTTSKDLPNIYSLFEQAIAFQKSNNYPVWNGYDKEVLQKDIKAKLQYKIIEENEISCIFTTYYTDPIIWGEQTPKEAIYLHRIVTNPNHRGLKQFEKVMTWTKNHAQKKNLQSIRMDTWADNPKIIQYYLSFGFQFLGNYLPPGTNELPITYRNLNLALLELPL